MANSYWSQRYGRYASNPEALHGKDRDEFVKKWKEMQKLFYPSKYGNSEGSADVCDRRPR